MRTVISPFYVVQRIEIRLKLFFAGSNELGLVKVPKESSTTTVGGLVGLVNQSYRLDLMVQP